MGITWLSLLDLKELARYLDSDLSPDDCLGLSDLDGFLTGIVVGPELIIIALVHEELTSNSYPSGSWSI
jgi:hypothetical protein